MIKKIGFSYFIMILRDHKIQRIYIIGMNFIFVDFIDV